MAICQHFYRCRVNKLNSYLLAFGAAHFAPGFGVKLSGGAGHGRRVPCNFLSILCRLLAVCCNNKLMLIALLTTRRNSNSRNLDLHWQ